MWFKALMTSFALGSCMITAHALLYATPSPLQLLVGGIADSSAGDVSRKLIEAGFEYLCLEPFYSADELAQLNGDRAFRYVYYGERTTDSYHVFLVRGLGGPKYIAVRQFITSDPGGQLQKEDCIPLSRVTIAINNIGKKRARTGTIEPVQLLLRVSD